MPTPNIGRVKITTTSAQVKSDGTCAAAGTDLMFLCLTASASGTLLKKIVFTCVASAAAVASVATTLRVYITTVGAAGATTSANTFLLGEIVVPIITASQAAGTAQAFVIELNQDIPTGTFINVSQHVAQTTNQVWQAICYASDY